MPESNNIPHVLIVSKPFGVNVEWKWPDDSHLFSQLELQYLFEDGQLVSESFIWPVAEKSISGLKAGERLQVRLRQFNEDSSKPGWKIGDWVEGVSSTNLFEIMDTLQQEINCRAVNQFASKAVNCDAFTADEISDAVEHIKRKRKEKADAKAMAETSPFVVEDGKVFIKDAVIGNGIVSANYNVKLNINNDGKEHAAGMVVGVEGDQSKVVFKADRFHVNEPAKSIIENAVATSTSVKVALSDEMTQAIIDAVRESNLFTALQANIDAQTASIIGLQQAMHDAVRDAIRNALQPGGAIWVQQRAR